LEKVRVRFAPSPTGELHIGWARTALFNWLFARHNGGCFILRIDDTDAARSTEASRQGITDGMRWLGLDWDEGPGIGGEYGPYLQSQRIEFYREAVERLLAEGKAYRCYCTPDELEAMREEARQQGLPPRYSGRCYHLSPDEEKEFQRQGRKAVVRLKVPNCGQTVVNDLVRGKVVFENTVLDDFIILKSNGIPTYNFASVVDDHMMKITHIIRAEEHLSNTPRQVIAFKALGYSLPAFAHVPMILAPDRSKLSKRHGATSVQEFRDQGYLPEAIVNYLALLGWSPSDGEEIMSMEKMVAEFSLDRVSKTASIYDVKKLTWLNANYLRDADPDRLLDLVLPRLIAQGLINDKPGQEEVDMALKALIAVQERVHTINEIVDAVTYFFDPEFEYDEKGVRKYFQKDGAAELLREIKDVLKRVEEFDLEHTEAALRELAEKKGVSAGKLFHPTRLALTGRTMGPGLFDIVVILGKERCLKRLDRAIEFINSR